jgi:protease-4
MRLFGRIILILLAVVGSLTLLFAGFGTFAVMRHQPAPLPKQMVLSVDLNAGLTEAVPDNPLAQLRLGRAMAVKDLVETLDRAARDPAVTAVVARLDHGSLGMGQAQEIRDAIQAFRKSNKRTVLYSTSLGEMGNGTVAYYLASAFQEIWLQPSGGIGLTGFSAERPFLKGTLDALGIQAQFGARHEYKSAIETLTQTRFTKESRESLQMVIDAWTRQATDGIAEDRHLTPQQVKNLIDRGPLMADEAKSGGLVDRLAYWDEADKSLTEGGARIVDIKGYMARLQPEPSAVKVALIFGVGTVQRGSPDDDPFNDSAVMSSERIGKAFRDAVKAPDVKAIVFRIDSPGGSYTASDTIWREVANARAAGKPVIVTMGNVAASGGYFSAMAADRIIAQPGTITGSIGVFAGKIVLGELWKKLGVSWDEVHSGQNAGIWSTNAPFSPAGWERLNSSLDHIYADFTGKAEQARKIGPDAMDKLARGRIWPGDEAKRVGLIDQTGGYAQALVAVRDLARLPAQMPIDLQTFPRPKPPLEFLLDIARSGRLAEETQAALAGQAQLARVLSVAEPWLGMIGPGSDATLKMAPMVDGQR